MSSTIFYYSNGTTTTSSSVTITSASYSIPSGHSLIGVDIGSIVTTIGSSCFLNRTTLVNVSFLATSTCVTIQTDAFRGCTGLTSIIFPASLRTIQNTAFYQSGLTTVNIPSTITTLGNDCFGNMKITTITIPNTVTSLGLGVIGSNSLLTSVVFESGRTSIPGYTCNSCPKLTDITLPNSITSIGFAAFEYCTSMQAISFPTSLQNIASRAFQFCSSLNMISFPTTLTTIGTISFARCNSLASLTIPSTLTTYTSAFQFCTGLTTLTFASGCTEISQGSFWGCSNLSTINFSNTITLIRQDAFRVCTALTSLVMPTSLLTLQKDVFESCTGLTSVVLPEGLTTFAGFTSCVNLQNINIPSTVTVIGENALLNATSIVGPIILPPNLTYIGVLAFAYTNKFSGTLTIPSTVTEIAYWAFQFNSGITNLVLPEGLISLSGFDYCTGLTSISIPSTVKYLNYRAFADTTITSVSFPEGLIIIGQEAFSRCLGLTSIVLPSTVTQIQDNAFSFCSNLVSVSLNQGLQTINGFQHCTSLTSISIPSTVTSLGGFYGCSNLASINIPYGVTTIGNTAFAFCTSLVNVVIPDSVTVIGNESFDRCTSLASIKLSNNLTYLGYTSFRQTKLSTITFPASIVNLGYYQFSWCLDFTSVIFVNTSNLSYSWLGPIFTENPPLPVQVRFLAATSYSSLNEPSKQLANWLVNFNGVAMTNITIEYGPPCFLEGTKILTLVDFQECWVPVETLRPTDLVKTIYNSYIPIDVIGYKDIDNLETDERTENRLYVYRKGTQHPELFEDLVLTGTHSVLVKEITEKEKREITSLLGGIYITDKHYRLPACIDKRSEPYQKGGQHRIYHFALENSDYYMNYGVYANGMLVESCSKRYMNEIANMTLFYAE